MRLPNINIPSLKKAPRGSKRPQHSSRRHGHGIPAAGVSGIVSIAIMALAVVAIVLGVVVANLNSRATAAESSATEAVTKLAQAQANNSALEQKKSEKLIPWRNAQGRLAANGDGSGKVCYLTFDDGPSSTYTQQYLDTLTEKGAVATWFVFTDDDAIDYLDLSLLSTIEQQGSAVGVEGVTFDNEYGFYKASVDNFFDTELTPAIEAVEDELGHDVTIMRFPGGSSVIANYSKDNAKAIPIEALNRGYQYFDWNINPKASGNTADTIVNNVLQSAQPFADSNSPICIVLPDSRSSAATAEALPRIIDGLSDLGYSFSTLSYDSPGFYQMDIS